MTTFIHFLLALVTPASSCCSKLSRTDEDQPRYTLRPRCAALRSLTTSYSQKHPKTTGRGVRTRFRFVLRRYEMCALLFPGLGDLALPNAAVASRQTPAENTSERSAEAWGLVHSRVRR